MPASNETPKPRALRMRVVDAEPKAETPVGPDPVRTSFLRPKGNLSQSELALLLLLAVVPLLLVLVRITALPGIVGPGQGGAVLEALWRLGSSLNQTLSLTSVPPAERARVVYLLFLPTCALLIALARLTFGIRLLGFRSILVAVGFQHSGIGPSLVLILVVVATIALLRPHLKRIRLPYYARVSVILCIVAATMVAALLVGPWLRAEVLWNVAFFPVIVLGLLAEGVARTLDRDNLLTASWRAATTIVIAFLIALLSRVQVLQGVLLQFPELVVTQIVAIVLVSEFLDLRLFEAWDAKLTGMVLPRLFTHERGYHVAVVRNRGTGGVIGRWGLPAPKKRDRRSVQHLVDALRDGGHTVRVFEGDMTLLAELRDFIPPHARTGQPGGIVFNLAHGIQGEGRYAHVPAMLEMAGVAYTGPTPLGHAQALDKVVAKTLMLQAGVPTPPFCTMTSPADPAHGLRYPLAVKPRYEPSYALRIVERRPQLEKAVETVLGRFRQEVVVEEHVRGRAISVALLGNDPVESLPFVEQEGVAGKKICPAPLETALAARIGALARATYQACACRDFARIDMRVAESGEPYVVEVASIGILDRNGAFVLAAAQAGYSYADLVCRIVEIARTRYVRAEAVRSVDLAPEDPVDGEPRAGWAASDLVEH